MKTIKYRPDIDGLRAIAVTLVVLFHAAPELVSGGFVGVDVFFVISGYLITSIIQKEIKDNSFSLARFYAKRILRIFPALILVLISCLVFGYFVLLSREYKSLGGHVAAGAAYLSNFMLMKESGYFDTQAASKPLLHLWSLAIEEQFYLVWPVVLMIVMGKNRRPLIAVTVGIIISFWLCIGYTQRLPDVVFYAPITRCWELLVGASLVFMRRFIMHLYIKEGFEENDVSSFKYSAYCQLMSAFGIIAIGVSAFYFDHRDAFPYWRALAPCLGAALVIASGGATIVGRVLASKPFVYIGLISYPLYLWHWPALFFTKILTNNREDGLYILIAVLFSIAAAVVTYKLIEGRIRRAPAIASISVALFAFLVLVGAGGYLIYEKEGFPGRYPQFELQARNIDSFAWNEGGYNKNKECVALLENKFTQYCNLMKLNYPATIALIGDSTANHFYHGLSVALIDRDSSENLLQIGQGGCPPLVDVETIRETGAQNCNQVTNDVMKYISSHASIHTVILTMAGATYINDTLLAIKNGKSYYRVESTEHSVDEDPIAVLEVGLRRTIRKLLELNKRVIVLMSAPVLPFDPSECLSVRPYELMGPKRNSCKINQDDIAAVNNSYRALIGRIVGEYRDVDLWDPYDIICTGVYCQPINEKTTLYRDSLHLSIYGSEYFGRNLLRKYSISKRD